MSELVLYVLFCVFLLKKWPFAKFDFAIFLIMKFLVDLTKQDQ